MKYRIKILEPSGYCKGVENAINMLMKIVDDNNYPKPIYVLGQIVHNSFVTNFFQDVGVINIDNNFEDEIKKIKHGTIVISAHGISKKIVEQLRMTNLKIVNTTCPYVNVVHKKIEKMLHSGYSCLYIGHENHPETNGILGISDDIILLTRKSRKLPTIINDKIFVSNQTTFSYFEIQNILDNLKNKYPHLIFDNDICDESTRRQLVVKNSKDLDLLIVVGDPKSSNSNRLYEAAISNNISAIFISSVNDLVTMNFANIENIGIIGGASTPDEIIAEIVDYLNKHSE